VLAYRIWRYNFSFSSISTAAAANTKSTLFDTALFDDALAAIETYLKVRKLMRDDRSLS
jgi:hypothetical protein